MFYCWYFDCKITMRDTNDQWKQEQDEQEQFYLLKASSDSWDRIFGGEVKLIRQNEFQDFVQSHENDAKH